MIGLDATRPMNQPMNGVFPGLQNPGRPPIGAQGPANIAGPQAQMSPQQQQQLVQLLVYLLMTLMRGQQGQAGGGTNAPFGQNLGGGQGPMKSAGGVGNARPFAMNPGNARGWNAPQAGGDAQPMARGGAIRNPTGPANLGSTPQGDQLARSATGIARARNTTGRCYAAVADALDKHGVHLQGMSAYMAADQLAQKPQFREVRADPARLGQLPAGAVVVWGQTARSPHGHISISDGRGNEISDHIDRQRTQLRGATNVRVFVPQGALA